MPMPLDFRVALGFNGAEQSGTHQKKKKMETRRGEGSIALQSRSREEQSRAATERSRASGANQSRKQQNISEKNIAEAEQSRAETHGTRQGRNPNVNRGMQGNVE